MSTQLYCVCYAQDEKAQHLLILLHKLFPGEVGHVIPVYRHEVLYACDPTQPPFQKPDCCVVRKLTRADRGLEQPIAWQLRMLCRTLNKAGGYPHP